MRFRKTALALAAFTAACSLFFTSGTFSSPSDAGASSQRGDVNEDGKVNILDLISLKNILLGIDTKEETTETTAEETIPFEETKFDAPVTEAPDTIVTDEKILDVKEVNIPADINIPARSQFIKNKEEYSIYLDEINVPENISSELLSDTAYFNDYYLEIFTVSSKQNSLTDPRAELDGNTIRFSYTEDETYIKSKDNTASGKYLFEIRIPKKLCNDEEPVFEAEIMLAFIPHVYYKPVIYLYPEETTNINVKLSFDGELKYTYPKYPENGWNVTASPDSVLHDASGREYSYLFWEGTSNTNWDMSKGFVVKGSDTVAFLQEKLEYLGLTPKEYNDFIVFWLPKMQDNEYNLISFQTDLYEKSAKLEITPEPDSIQRVFMAFKPLDKYEEIPEQKLEPFTRHGYSVIEWGGTEITDNSNICY